MAKLAEVVAKFIEAQGIRHVFTVNGGACLHLLHGLVDVTSVKVIPNTHEMCSGFAADAYARLNGLGCAIVTSGPGATNIITAIAAAFQDNVPVLFISGNVNSDRMGSKYGVKFYGFQETPIVDMVRGITKYAKQITNPAEILSELGYAVHMAQTGRKGPVLIDIPDDFQRADIDPDKLLTFEYTWYPPDIDHSQISAVIKLLQEARRPIFVWGAGMRPYAKEAADLARSLGVPVACTWGAIDLMPSSDPLMGGGFGTHGTRAANFAVQNSDLIISIGSRLDTKATGGPTHFAREARIVMVDIDAAEISKFTKLGRKIDVGICADAGEFIAALEDHSIIFSTELMHDWAMWRSKVQIWRNRYDTPVVPWPGINPYELMKEIGKWTTSDDVICSDTGCTLGWLMQGFPFNGEKFLHALNMTPMGYGLPAAIGASFATGKRIILVTGDGSILMSLAELATIARWNLNIKIILLNNKGHAMCRQSQRQWLGGTYPATSLEGGLGFPDFVACAESFGIPAWPSIEHLFKTPDPFGFCEVRIHPDAQLVPQTRFGYPIEDGEPSLPRDEFRQQMIVEPLEGYRNERETSTRIKKVPS